MSKSFGKKEKNEKPKYNMWQNAAYMIVLAWNNGEKKVPLLCLAQAMIAVITSLVNLFVTPTILGAVERHAPLGVLLGTILVFSLGIMLCAAISAYVNENTLFGRISVRSEFLRQLNQKYCMVSYPVLLDDHFLKMKERASRSVGGNSRATEAVWGTLVGLVQNFAGFIIYLFLMTRIDWPLLCVIIITSVIVYYITRYVSGYWHRHREEDAACEQRVDYLINVEGTVKAAKDIRIFGLRPYIKELLQKAYAAYEAFERRGQYLYVLANIADLVMTFVRNGIAYFYLIRMVLGGEISTAEFLLLFSAVNGFTGWISGILDGLHTLYQQSLDLSNVREVIEYPEVFRFEDGEPLPIQKDHSYQIELRDVSFTYPGAEKPTLSHIDLTLHRGEKLAVVGLNGAGKSTLIKLLCGFFDPTEGAVLLDGVDIRIYNRRDYYAMFSAVFQQFCLLACSVAANVAQTETDIDMARMKTCVAQAGLTEKIESLPNTYDTMLNREVYLDAVMLSGGETQRLMLARALYKDAPFVVLDEPTAALDPLAEEDIYNKYKDMTDGKSSVYISHRLASTRFCDRIILLENGVIAEEGTHTELLEKNGRYAALFAVQSKYYKEGADIDETEKD